MTAEEAGAEVVRGDAMGDLKAAMGDRAAIVARAARDGAVPETNVGAVLRARLAGRATTPAEPNDRRDAGVPDPSGRGSGRPTNAPVPSASGPSAPIAEPCSTASRCTSGPSPMRC